jgi:2-iminoacetate synthase
MVELGITSMSAGSKTDPGGYTISDNELEQFTTNDNRNPKEMIQMIHNQGYDVIWKDWDACLEQKKYN